MSKASYISPLRQPPEKRKKSEEIKAKTAEFLAAGGEIYRAKPSEHEQGRISQWRYFTLPGSPREEPKMKTKQRRETGKSADCVAQTIIDEANKKLVLLGYIAKLVQTENKGAEK